ncbi:MAG: hypothetical protein Q8Q14_04975 [Gemmatimonadales bacterium]|nr:hypothetical protein [Gemmatimonadales bacterium]
MYRTVFAALVCAATLASPGIAQQAAPSQRQVDSLTAEIGALRTRLDSVIAALRPGAQRVAAPAGVDELARLRAAAANVTGRDTTQRADTTAPRFVGRDRNLSQLNPEISVTGNLHGTIQTEGEQRDNVELHEVEFSFQAALDPYSYTKIFVGLHEGEIEIEEGYFYYTGFPYRLRLDVGVFRQQVGELNRWHLHAVPETEYPLVLTTFLGEEGLAGAGASLYRAFGGLGTHELYGQVTAGANDVLFEGGNRPSYLVRLNNFWQLGRATYMQLGATGIYGTNPDTALKTTLGGVDFRFTWRPPARALYRDWTIRAEAYRLKKERGGSGAARYGGFVGTTYKLGRRWIAGARYDYVEVPEGANEITRQVVPSLTWWQSEWVFLRAEFARRLTPAGGGERNRLVLQAVWAMGPHKHETY